MATIKDAHIFKDGKPVMRGNATYENSTLTIKEAKWTDDGAKKNLPFMMKGGMEVKVGAAVGFGRAAGITTL